jgi:hypothetical protein
VQRLLFGLVLALFHNPDQGRLLRFVQNFGPGLVFNFILCLLGLHFSRLTKMFTRSLS